MADRLNATLVFIATDAADDSDFSKIQLDWAGVPYGDFVQMQGLLVEVANKMQAWGEEVAKAKGKKK